MLFAERVMQWWRTGWIWHEEETVGQIKKLASAQDRQARDMSNTNRKLSRLPGAMQPCSLTGKHHNKVQTMTGCCNVTSTTNWSCQLFSAGQLVTLVPKLFLSKHD